MNLVSFSMFVWLILSSRLFISRPSQCALNKNSIHLIDIIAVHHFIGLLFLLFHTRNLFTCIACIVVVVFLSFIIVVVPFLVDKKNLCTTPGCINAAASILNRIDGTVQPCDDFYDFACGQYVRETSATMPDDKIVIDMFSSVYDRIEAQLKSIINEPIQANETKAFQLSKRLNASCMNRTAVEMLGLKQMNAILDAFGGWPVAKGSAWNESAFDWIDVIGRMRNIGLATSYIFSLSIGANFKNSSMQTLRVSDNSP